VVTDQDLVEHSRRSVPMKRSAIAFARGARTGVWMIRMSEAAKTASNAVVNLLSRSRIKNRSRSARSSRSYDDMAVKLRRVIIAARFRSPCPEQATPQETRAVLAAWAAAET
jgi:hypothetical protein